MHFELGRGDTCKIKCSFYKVFWGSSSPGTVHVQRRTPERFLNLKNPVEVPELSREWTGFSIILKVEPYLKEKRNMLTKVSMMTM